MQPISVLRGHYADVQCLEFLSPGLLVAGDSTGVVKMWDMDSLRAVHSCRLHGQHAGVLSVQKVHSPSGCVWLLSAGRDGSIKVWQIDESGCPSTEPVFQVALSASHTFCRPHSAPWPPAQQPTPERPPAEATLTQKVQGSLPSDGAAASIAPSPPLGPECGPSPPPAAAAPGSAAGSPWLLAFAGESGGQVQLCDVREPAKARHATLQACSPGGRSPGLCTAVAVLRGGGTGGDVASGFEDGSVVAWDLRQPARPAASGRKHQEPVLCLSASSSGCEVVSGSAGPEVCWWALGPRSSSAPLEADGGAETAAAGSLRMAACCALKRPGVSDVCCSADGRLVTAAGWDGKVRLLSANEERWKVSETLRYHQKEVCCVRFSPGGDGDSEMGHALLASASRDGTVALWDGLM